MSAFVVSYNHINALVKWTAQNTVQAYVSSPLMRLDIAAKQQEIAELLYAENIKSVEFRYSEKLDLAPIVYNSDVQTLLPIEAIKLVHSLAYQSNEHEEWENSTAFIVCNAIETAALRQLPGYDAAPWAIG